MSRFLHGEKSDPKHQRGCITCNKIRLSTLNYKAKGQYRSFIKPNKSKAMFCDACDYWTRKKINMDAHQAKWFHTGVIRE